MKHTIRINGEVKEIDCELGSGILDENGREIFEGDKVKRYVRNSPKYHRTISEEKVVFRNGTFGSERHGVFRPLEKACYLEIVDD